MPNKIFIDTNIVIYALGQASTKAHLAAPLFVGSPSISTQVLSETANVASKRLALSVSEIHKLITSLEVMCRVQFLGELHRYGIAMIDMNDDELAEDIINA